MIVAGASAYPRERDFKKFKEIADEVGAYLMVDMAHIAGLVAAGLHQKMCIRDRHSICRYKRKRKNLCETSRMHK